MLDIPNTTLFMLMSVDGKTSTDSDDELRDTKFCMGNIKVRSSRIKWIYTLRGMVRRIGI